MMQTADSMPGKDKKIPCKLLSWEQCYQMARQLAYRIREDSYQPDLIVAIARGGLMPARVLSDHFDLFDLASLKIEHYRAVHKDRIARVRYPLTASIEGRRVLLVDDVSDSGDTFEVAIQHLKLHGEPEDLRTAVLHHKRVSRYRPDYFAEEIVVWVWVIYPWAVMEDLGSLLQRMEPPPITVEALGEALSRLHGIEPSKQLLEDVLAKSQSAS